MTRRAAELSPGAPAALGWRSAALHRCGMPDAEGVNRAVEAEFDLLADGDFDRRSHFFGGRFENLYVAPDRVPAVLPILDRALSCAGSILGRPPGTLRCGFWFNRMEPGQGTSEHTHDEHDELLSAVYYVRVPDDSGDLLLYDDPATVRITPEAGTFLFFPPALPHAVETNRGQARRLSIGLNIGPR